MLCSFRHVKCSSGAVRTAQKAQDYVIKLTENDYSESQLARMARKEHTEIRCEMCFVYFPAT